MVFHGNESSYFVKYIHGMHEANSAIYSLAIIYFSEFRKTEVIVNYSQSQ